MGEYFQQDTIKQVLSKPSWSGGSCVINNSGIDLPFTKAFQPSNDPNTYCQPDDTGSKTRHYIAEIMETEVYPAEAYQ